MSSNWAQVSVCAYETAESCQKHISEIDRAKCQFGISTLSPVSDFDLKLYTDDLMPTCLIEWLAHMGWLYSSQITEVTLMYPLSWRAGKYEG